MADNNFFENTQKAEQITKQAMNGANNGSAIRYSDDTPQGEDRVTLLISLTKADKLTLQQKALAEGVSAAELVRRALREAGMI